MPTTSEPVADVAAYEVRPPRPDDALAIGELHCRVWRETYADLMDPEVLARLDPARFTENWSRVIAELDSAGCSRRDGSNTRVAAARQGIVGFVTVGPARDEEAPAPVQLWALNLVGKHHGTGLADRLMADVLGAGPAYLWVAHGNDRAIAFYRRHGFSLDGVVSDEQQAGIREERMVCRALD